MTIVMGSASQIVNMPCTVEFLVQKFGLQLLLLLKLCKGHSFFTVLLDYWQAEQRNSAEMEEMHWTLQGFTWG